MQNERYQLSPEQFNETFPFHVVFDQRLIIQQTGRSLRTLCPDAITGASLDSLYLLKHPHQKFNYESLRKAIRKLIVLEPLNGGPSLRGQMILTGTDHHMIFLCSPWITSPEAMVGSGLSMSHFAIHDPIVDLLHVMQAQRTSLGEVKDFAKKLKAQKVELKTANTQLTEQNQALKEAGAKVENLSGRLSLAIKSAAIGIWEWDIPNDILSWDDRMHEMYELPRPATGIVYEEWAKRIHPDDRGAIEKAIGEALAGNRDYDAEFRITTPAGKLRFIKAHGIVQRSIDGQATKMIGANYDITESKQSEENLRRANSQLERATRLKEEFLANMSHEIRTPMNGVIGLTQLLEDTDLSAEQRDYVGKIKLSGDVLLRIINDILDFSKIESGKLDIDSVEFRLSEVMTGVQEIFVEQTRAKQITLTIDVDPDLPPMLVGDPYRLNQILLNLVGNAIKFTDRDGAISIRARRHPENTTDTRLRFEVSDNGVGIPKSIQPELFKAFTQADGSTTRKFGGTGLGLAICKQLTNLMGGTIGVESVVGDGATFWFQIPFGNAQSTPPSSETEFRGELQGNR